MKTDSFLKQLVFWMLALVLPAFRMVFALEQLPSGSDIVSLDIAELDAFSRVSLTGEKTDYYGLVFWEQFVITVIEGPQPGESETEYDYKIREKLSVTLLNVPDSVPSATIRSFRYQDAGHSRVLVVGRLDQRFTGLTEITLAYQEGIVAFSQWLEKKKRDALTAVINGNGDLQRLPLVFIPDAFSDIDNEVVAQHSGSSLNATTALLKLVRPGMACLGQDRQRQGLMLLGIKADFDVFQNDKLDGEQNLEINFRPLESFIHLLATTAGMDQSTAYRWTPVENGIISAMALTDRDVSGWLKLSKQVFAGGYLCQAHCLVGAVLPGERQCHTRKGDFDDYLVLEGRRDEWQHASDGLYPDNAMATGTAESCQGHRDIICFVGQPGSSGFGVVLRRQGCSLGGKSVYREYYVPLVVPGDSEPSTVAYGVDHNSSNTTDDYFGASQVVVLFNGVSNSLFVSDSADDSAPNLQPPEPDGGLSSQSSVIIVVVFSVIILVASVGGTLIALYCFCKKCRNTEERNGRNEGSESYRYSDLREQDRDESPDLSDCSDENLLSVRRTTTDQAFRNGVVNDFDQRMRLYQDTGVAYIPGGLVGDDAELIEAEMLNIAIGNSLSEGQPHSEGACVSVMLRSERARESQGRVHQENQGEQGTFHGSNSPNTLETLAEVYEYSEPETGGEPDLFEGELDLDEHGDPVVVKSKPSRQ